jgi:hypothetical protein
LKENPHGLIFTSIFAQVFFIFAHILGKHQDFAEKKKNSAQFKTNTRNCVLWKIPI